MTLAAAFPAVPELIGQALHSLATMSSGDANAIRELGDVKDLPRPWDPSTCPPVMRRQLWRWCDDVACWLNSETAWRPTQLIPMCWPQHPHLAQELPLLGCLRVLAANDYRPDQLQVWQGHTLPQFWERLAARLGEGTCRTGTHQDWPAGSRYDSFTSPQAVATRQYHFDGDLDTDD